MVMRVQLIDGEFHVIVPAAAAAALNLTDGAEVTVAPVAPDRPDTTSITAQEAVASYLRTEPLHHSTYTELAK